MAWDYSEEPYGGSMTMVTIKADNKKQMQKGINWYLHQYNPLGYSTRIVSKGNQTNETTKKTRYIGILHRYNSCD